MVKLTQSLEHWLAVNHPELLPLIAFGHIELFTAEMQKEYIEWCKTDEGHQYLKGGSKYEDSERNREIEKALEERMSKGGART